MIWTVIPILVLVVIAVPSMKLLFYMDKVPSEGSEAENYPEMTLKITGRQWYWSYEYPEHEGITFDSNMVPEDDLKPGQIRLQDVDNQVVLPVDTNVRLLITAGDVIHNWGIPAFGIKMDAVPGRTNETWMRVNQTGTYYGQCYELCGINHGFMPIAVKVVTKEEFDAWIVDARERFATADPEPRVVASNVEKN